MSLFVAMLALLQKLVAVSSFVWGNTACSDFYRVPLRSIAPGLISQQSGAAPSVSDHDGDTAGLESSSSLQQSQSAGTPDGVYRPIPGTALVAK